MQIQILLFVLLAVGLLYFTAWNYYIVFQQKKSWKTYANDKKLRFQPGRFLDSAIMEGIIDGRTVNIFPSEHMRANMRSSRKLCAIEVILKSKMPVEFAAGNEGYVDIIREIGFTEEFKVKAKNWKKDWVAQTNDTDLLQAYFTKERLEAVTALMGVNHAWSILIAREGVFLLRIDTPHPLETYDKIDKMVKKLLAMAKVFELEGTEAKELKIAKDKRVKSAGYVPDKSIKESSINFELEDDDSSK